MVREAHGREVGKVNPSASPFPALPATVLTIRKAVHIKKSQSYGHFPYGGGRGAQPHSIASGGVFPHYKGDSNTTKLMTKGNI